MVATQPSKLRHVYGEEFSDFYLRMDRLPKIVLIVAAVASLGVSIFNIFRFSLFGNIFNEHGYYFILIAILLPGIFLFKPIRNIRRWYDILLSFIAFCIPFYFFLSSEQMTLTGWDVSAPFHVEILSLILILITLEAVRKSGGLSLAIICLFFALFPLFASRMPVPIQGMDFGLWRIVSFHVMGTESFLGIPLRVVATLLIGFMFFAAALMTTGGGRFFLNFAMSLLGHTRGGPAKVSVVASAFFGSISGSAVSNVLSTGCVTIPTMKKTGYPPEYAASVEACSSTGGVLMPPVMGAAAFLIAQFLNIPYAQVAIAAAVPSILYYLALFVQVDAFSAKVGIKGLPKAEMPALKRTLIEGWYYLGTLVVLVWMLLYLRMEAQAPFFAIIFLFIFTSIRKETRLNLHRFGDFLVSSGRMLSELMSIMLAVGLIIGSLSMTGIAHSFSSDIIRLAGGNIYLLILLSAITSFILGMGMSVTACYLLLAILVGPALIQSGLDPLAVHLFILYWGMISYITPPVAVAAIVAAGIAGCSPMKAAFRSTRLGAVIYFVPFFFILEPALILHGSIALITLAFVTAVIGVIFIAAGVEGYLIGVGKLNPLWRFVLGVSGLLLVYPIWQSSLIGACIAAISIVILKTWSKASLGKAAVSH